MYIPRKSLEQQKLEDGQRISESQVRSPENRQEMEKRETRVILEFYPELIPSRCSRNVTFLPAFIKKRSLGGFIVLRKDVIDIPCLIVGSNSMKTPPPPINPLPTTFIPAFSPPFFQNKNSHQPHTQVLPIPPSLPPLPHPSSVQLNFSSPPQTKSVLFFIPPPLNPP